MGAYTNGLRGWGYVLSALLLVVAPFYSRSEERLLPLTWKRRLRMAVVCLLPMMVLTVTQYIVSTPPGSLTVSGMQERYSLPVWSLLFLALMLPEKWRRRTTGLSEIAAGLTAAAITLVTVLADQNAILCMWLPI